MSEQMELSLSMAARDEALGDVAEHSHPWFTRAYRALLDADLPATFTGEDVRFAVGDRVGRPHHHNAWGALIMAAVRDGIIERTGEFTKMRARSSHARMTPLYRRGVAYE